MIRILLAIVLFFSCSISCFANNGKAITGSIELKETIDGKKTKDVVDYIIKGKLARINASPKLYYIVELDTKKAYLVNDKRKTVTLMYASDIMNHELPPLMILQDKTSLKQYLVSINGHLEGLITKGASKFECWRFNIGAVYYKIQILLPDYYPKIIYITSNKNTTMATILEKTDISPAQVPENAFEIPKNYQKVDLISR